MILHVFELTLNAARQAEDEGWLVQVGTQVRLFVYWRFDCVRRKLEASSPESYLAMFDRRTLLMAVLILIFIHDYRFEMHFVLEKIELIESRVPSRVCFQTILQHLHTYTCLRRVRKYFLFSY